MTYTLTFTAEQAQALWQCIQHAPLPRVMTDELARSFREQIERRNRELEIEARAKANGHAAEPPPS